MGVSNVVARLPHGTRLVREDDGRLVVRLYLGTSKVTGRAVRPQLSFPAGTPVEDARGEAEAWVRRQYAARKLADDATVGELMQAYLGRMRKAGTKANTVSAYARCAELAAPLAPSGIDEVSAADVDELLASLSSTYARATVDLEKAFLSGFWDRMRALGVTDGNPVRGVRLPKGGAERRPKALDEIQARALNDTLLREGFADVSTVRRVRDRVCAFGSWVALNTGLRVGEVCALRRADFLDGEEPTLMVRGTVDASRERHDGTKTGGMRRVALSAEVADGIRRHLAWSGERWGKASNMPMVSTNGNFMRPNDLSGWFGRRARALRLPKWVRFHTLRHTHATLLIASGVDAKTVSERLGHADVATTLRYYGHVMPGRDRQAAARFDEILGNGED